MRAILGTVARQVGVGLAYLALFALISRSFGPEGVARYGLVHLAPILIAQALGIGLQSAAILVQADPRVAPASLVRQMLGWAGLLGGGAALIMLGPWLIWSQIGAPLSIIQGMILLSAILPHLLVLLLTGVAQGAQDFGLFNLFLLLPPMVQSLVAMGQIAAGAQLEAVLLGPAGAAWAAAAVVCGLSLRVWGVRGARVALRPYLAQGALAHASTCVTLVIYRLPLWTCAGLLGAQATGLLLLAQQIGEKLWLPSQAAASHQLPKAARLARDPRVLHAMTMGLARRIALITGLLAVALGGVSPSVFPLVFGPDAQGAAPALWLLLPGIVAWAPSRILAHDLLARGAAGRNLHTALLTLAALAVALPIGAQGGLLGVCGAISLAYGADLVIRSHLHAQLTRGVWFGWAWPRRVA